MRWSWSEDNNKKQQFRDNNKPKTLDYEPVVINFVLFLFNLGSKIAEDLDSLRARDTSVKVVWIGQNNCNQTQNNSLPAR
mgnify:CR=1 FL=1